jgi:predicted aspartyl protease
MGVFSVTLKVRNAVLGGEFVDLLAKVDTGATLLVISQALADELKLPVRRKQTVKYADERTAELDVVWGLDLEVCGRGGVFEAVVEPRKNYGLLGAIVMETLDLLVDPRGLQLYPNPRSKLPMAEIE